MGVCKGSPEPMEKSTVQPCQMLRRSGMMREPLEASEIARRARDHSDKMSGSRFYKGLGVRVCMCERVRARACL